MANSDDWWKLAVETHVDRPATALVALDHYETAVGRDDPSRILRAHVYAELRRFEDSARLLDECAADVHERHLVRERANLMKHRGDFAAEEGFRRRALELDADSTDKWIMLGSCLIRQGRHQEALECYRRATEATGDRDEAWLNVGQTERALGRLEQAAEAAARALELSPTDAQAQSLRDDVHLALSMR